MEQDNKKIMTFSFLIAGFLVGLVVELLFTTLAGVSGMVARIRGMDLFGHGIPVFAGMVVFFVLQFNPKIRIWADESILEVRKVVWPSRKDTIAMTTVACVMVVVAGLMLGLFDVLTGSLVKLLID